MANLDRSEEQTQKKRYVEKKRRGKRKDDERKTKTNVKKKKEYEKYKQIRNMKINFNSQPFFLLHVFEKMSEKISNL